MFTPVDNRFLQILQESERACNMTVDALETLGGDLRALAGTAAVELQAIRGAMALAQPGTPSRQLQRRRFEEKFSEFFAQKYALLAEMQARRRQTLAQLEAALDRLQRENGAAHRPWREKAREEIRRNNERLAEIRLELAPLLARWKDDGQTPEERSALARRIRALRRSNWRFTRPTKTACPAGSTATANTMTISPACATPCARCGKTCKAPSPGSIRRSPTPG